MLSYVKIVLITILLSNFAYAIDLNTLRNQIKGQYYNSGTTTQVQNEDPNFDANSTAESVQSTNAQSTFLNYGTTLTGNCTAVIKQIIDNLVCTEQEVNVDKNTSITQTKTLTDIIWIDGIVQTFSDAYYCDLNNLLYPTQTECENVCNYISCPDNYSLDAGQCYQAPNCLFGSYNKVSKQCELLNTSYSCSLGGTYDSLTACELYCNINSIPTITTTSTNHIQFANSEYVRLFIDSSHFTDWILLSSNTSRTITYPFLWSTITASLAVNNYMLQMKYTYTGNIGGYTENTGWVNLKLPTYPSYCNYYYGNDYRTAVASSSWGSSSCSASSYSTNYIDGTMAVSYCGQGTGFITIAQQCGSIGQHEMQYQFNFKSDIYPNPNTSLTCPLGYTLSGTSCIKTGTCSQSTCPAGTTASGSVCVSQPTCGYGIFEPSLDLCEAAGIINQVGCIKQQQVNDTPVINASLVYTITPDSINDNCGSLQSPNCLTTSNMCIQKLKKDNSCTNYQDVCTQYSQAFICILTEHHIYQTCAYNSSINMVSK